MGWDHWIAALYAGLGARRKNVWLLTGLLLLAGGASLLWLERDENVRVLIPDQNPQLIHQFQLLQQAPLTRKLVVLIEGEDPPKKELMAAADSYAQSFNRTGVGHLESRLRADLPGLLKLLVRELPQRFPATELPRLSQTLDTTEIRRRLQRARDELMSLEGLGSKAWIQADPLSLRNRVFADLAYTNLTGKGKIQEGYLFSREGDALLLIGETDIPLTDTQGAERLEAAAKQAAAMLPPTIKGTMLCGQLYTLANARAIKQDLHRIGLLVSLGLLLVFGFFLRDWRALPVLLLPLAAVALALGLVFMSGQKISGITLGFGAVVLGVALDYGLHVYFALRHRCKDVAKVMSELSRPLILGATTSIGAFAVLLCSDLPVQRQLGAFAGTGLFLAMLLALLLLPLLPEQTPQPLPATTQAGRTKNPKRALLWAWLLLLAFGLVGGTRIEVNGDLRQINMVPPHLAKAESRLRDGWGDLRGRAILLLQGETEKVRQQNDRLFAKLRQVLAPNDMVSLAPLIPSQATRATNLTAWRAFWQSPSGQRIVHDVQQEATSLGFTQDAFAPFFASLDSRAVKTRPLPAGFEQLVANLQQKKGDQLQLLTLVADNPDIANLPREMDNKGLTLLSPSLFRQELSEAVKRDFLRLAPLAGGMVLLLTTLLLRRIQLVFAALAPVISGVVATLGVMGWAGIAFNLFNAVAMVLVIGLTVDYGIFMVWRCQKGKDRITDRAVLVSGLTTLAGFGSLALAEHPAMFAMGISVLIGIGAAIPTALWIVPALFGTYQPGEAQ